MTYYVLHLDLDALPQALPWQEDLSSRHVVVLRAGSQLDAANYRRAYKLMLVLLEVRQVDDALLSAVRELACPGAAGAVPVMALTHEPLSEADLARLAQAGVADIALAQAPAEFILWHLDLLCRLGDLGQFEQTRMDVNQLACRTREHLHDLSQPLSAVQGRLQLMAARCANEDPNATHLQDLVRLIFEVSHQVMEIHQIHRRYS